MAWVGVVEVTHRVGNHSVVSGSLPKVKIKHDLRTQGFLTFGNQGDKV